MKHNLFRYLALYLLSFVIALAVLTPMKLIISTLPLAQLKGVTLQKIQGNLWQGSLQLRYQKLKTQVQWAIHPSHVFSDKSVLNLQLKTPKSQITLKSDFDGLNPQLKLVGNLNSQEISRKLTLPQHANMTGNIIIKQLLFNNTPPYYLKQADIHWAGGQISANNKNSSLPALQLRSQKKQEILINQVFEASNQKQLILISAHQNKQADINVSQRLLSLLNQGKLSDNEDEFVIRFTEQLTF